MLFIFLSIALLAVFVAWAFVLFRMGQESSKKADIWLLMKEAMAFNVFSFRGKAENVRQEVLVGGSQQDVPEEHPLVSLEKKGTFEKLLQEKNTLIGRLQKDLSSELAHRAEFEKVLELLQGQISELRTQNKKLRQEMDDLAARHARASTSDSVAPAFVSRLDPDDDDDHFSSSVKAVVPVKRHQESSADDVPAVLRRLVGKR